jgi:hypothetical protein
MRRCRSVQASARAALVATLGAGCGSSTTVPVDAPTGPCPGVYQGPDELAVAEPSLREASGVAPSLRNPGVLWLHNDSGDRARLFAIGTDGAALGQLAVPGPAAPDLEDVATAACPDGSGPCIWIADTGNNGLDRTDLALHAVPEPAVSAAAPLGMATAATAWRIPLSYGGLAIDSEALAVAADGNSFVLFEKVDDERARVFTATGPFADGAPVTLTLAGTVTSPGVAITYGRMITGAALHPSGTRLALRVYTGIFEYRGLAGGWPTALDAAERVTVTLGPLSERQGEAVGYDETGRGLWTISEDPDGAATQPLHHWLCP